MVKNFDIEDYNAKSGFAFGIQSQQLFLWYTLALYTSQNHYLKWGYANTYGGANTNNRNSINPIFGKLPNTWAFNVALEKSIQSRKTKDINATFNEGLLLTLQKDHSNVSSIWYNHPTYENSKEKTIFDETKKYFADYGNVITSSIRDPRTNGLIVTEAGYDDLTRFGNTCYCIDRTKEGKFIHRYINLDSVAILRDGDLTITEFFLKKQMTFKDLESFFPGNVVKSLKREYGFFKKNQYSDTIIIGEWASYNKEKNITEVYYVDEQNKKLIYHKTVIGSYYTYITIGQNIGEMYGTSILMKNLHNIIFLQTIDFMLKEIYVKELTPDIRRFLQTGADEMASVNNNFGAGAYSQALGLLNNVLNKPNKTKNVNFDELGGAEMFKQLGVNPFVEMRETISYLDTIQLMQIIKQGLEQEMDKALGGGVVSQISNSSTEAYSALATKTLGELGIRIQQDNLSEATHYNQLLPFVSSIYNRYIQITMQDIILEINNIQAKGYDKIDILYSHDYYNGKIDNIEENFYQKMLLLEAEELKGVLIGKIDNPDYELAKNDIQLIDEAILESIKKEKASKNEWEKEETRNQIKQLQITKDFYIQDIFKTQVTNNTKYKINENFKRWKEVNAREDIIINYMPREVLEYILGYLESYKHFNDAFKLEYTGSSYRLANDRERNGFLEAIEMTMSAARVFQLAQNTPELDRLNSDEILTAIWRPVSEKAILSNKELNAKREAKQAQQIQMAEQMAAIQGQGTA